MKLIIDIPEDALKEMTNEDVLNDTLRKVFPNVIFIRSINEHNKTQAIHFSEEWLNQEYSEVRNLDRPYSTDMRGE